MYHLLKHSFLFIVISKFWKYCYPAKVRSQVVQGDDLLPCNCFLVFYFAIETFPTTLL